MFQTTFRISKYEDLRRANQTAEARDGGRSFNDWSTVAFFHYLNRSKAQDVRKQSRPSDEPRSDAVKTLRDELQEQLRQAYKQSVAQRSRDLHHGSCGV